MRLVMLTLKQHETLVFISNFISEKGYAPTVAEIAQGMGLKSRGVVHRHLRELERKGRIRLVPHRHRNIRLVTTPVSNLLDDEAIYSNMTALASSGGDPSVGVALPPIYLTGDITMNKVIEMRDTPEPMNLQSWFNQNACFALLVCHDGLLLGGIKMGDVMICARVETVLPTDIAIVRLYQNAVVLRQVINQTEETVLLKSVTDPEEPVEVPRDQVSIQGKYLGLIRRA